MEFNYVLKPFTYTLNLSIAWGWPLAHSVVVFRKLPNLHICASTLLHVYNQLTRQHNLQFHKVPYYAQYYYPLTSTSPTYSKCSSICNAHTTLPTTFGSVVGHTTTLPALSNTTLLIACLSYSCGQSKLSRLGTLNPLAYLCYSMRCLFRYLLGCPYQQPRMRPWIRWYRRCFCTIRNPGVPQGSALPSMLFLTFIAYPSIQTVLKWDNIVPMSTIQDDTKHSQTVCTTGICNVLWHGTLNKLDKLELIQRTAAMLILNKTSPTDYMYCKHRGDAFKCTLTTAI
jgi:hypothetical protein